MNSSIIVPDGQTLFPFQEEAVARMMHFLTTNETRSVYNACEQGLGKCAQAIAAINSLTYFDSRPTNILICCPGVMRLTWLDELRKWYVPQGGTLHASVLLSGKSKISSNIVITSYELAAKPERLKELSKISWDFLIADEAHYVNRIKALRTRAFYKSLWPRSRFRILLSGTPFTNNVTDGYTPFRHCAPHYFTDYFQFADRYANKQETPWGTKYYGLKNAEELSKIIRSTFYIRYRKDEVLKDLPAKTFQRITLPKEYALPLSRDEHEAAEAQLREILNKLDHDQAIPPVPTSLQGQRKLQGLKKIPPIVEFVKNILDNNEPIVLFAYHKDVIKQLEDELKDYNPVVITGETPAKARHRAVEDFQNGTTNLFIGNLVAAGVGITLTRASIAVLAELDWTPSVVAQACDRIHRIGQKNAVNIYYFVAENSIEMDIAEVVVRKAKEFAEVLE